MYKLYGIPNCDTVKKAISYLNKKGVAFEFINFKSKPPAQDDIIRWSKAYKSLPVNNKGITYRKLKDQFEELSEQHKIKFIQENASMIKRPILENKNKVLCFGFDEKVYSQVLTK